MRLESCLCIIILVLSTSSVFAQRGHTINDSTVYDVTNSFQLVAGRHHLYKIENGGSLQLVRDFTTTPIPMSADVDDYYIRDVDYWDALHWYVLYGWKYIGGDTTFVYETVDGGNNWSLKLNFIPQTNWNANTSINQLQTEGDSTLYLFNNYYLSSVVVSQDRGQTWHRWFQSNSAHYFQIYNCQGTRYMIGMNGDGFSNTSFKIPDSLYNTVTENWYSGCASGNNPICHYESPTVIGQFFNYLQEHIDYLDSACASQTNISSRAILPSVEFYPNPVTDILFIKTPNTSKSHFEIFDAIGKIVSRGQVLGNSINVKTLPTGNYFLRLTDHTQTKKSRFFKE